MSAPMRASGFPPSITARTSSTDGFHCLRNAASTKDLMTTPYDQRFIPTQMTSVKVCDLSATAAAPS